MTNTDNLFGSHEHLGSEFITPDEIFSEGDFEYIKIIIVYRGAIECFVVELPAEEWVLEEVWMWTFVDWRTFELVD